MSENTFREYARSPDLSDDATYTVELLIERVRDTFDPAYWDGWSERGDAREQPDYLPTFSMEHVEPAENELTTLTWLSFQRLRNSARPVRDVGALRYLSALSGLVLNGNEISDIFPLAYCANLRRLLLRDNPIRDISPLAACTEIEELDLGNTPIEDFTVLESLPQFT